MVRPAPNTRRRNSQRDAQARTVALVRVVLAFEASLYSIVTPILPHYASQFAASKPALGIMVGAYPAGYLASALLVMRFAGRIGVRRTTLSGLFLFALALVPFGFGSSLTMLDGLRFAEGAGAGCVWVGGMAWVIEITPNAARGVTLGSLVAMVELGTVAGPALGTLVLAVGGPVVFAGLGCVSLALMLWASRHPEPVGTTFNIGIPYRALIRHRRVVIGCWIVILVALAVGAINVLLPVRLASFGASGTVIGVVFAVGSLCNAAISPLVGRVLDRRGVIPPLIGGLSVSALLFILLPLPHTELLLAVLTFATVGGPLSSELMSAISVVSNGVESFTGASGTSSVLFNIAWAVGEIVGSPAAASLAHATSDAVPLVLLAALMLLTLGFVTRSHTRRVIRGESVQPAGASLARSATPGGTAEGTEG